MVESCTGYIKPGNKATLLPYLVTMAGANLDGSNAKNLRTQRWSTAKLSARPGNH